MGNALGTVVEGSSGGAWVIGNETLDPSRAPIGWATGCCLGSRSFGDAEQVGAHNKAAMQAKTTRLSLSIGEIYTCVSTLLGMGNKVA